VYHDAIIPAPTRDGVVIMIYRPEPADAARHHSDSWLLCHQ